MAYTVAYTDSERYKCLENLQKGAVELCLTYCGWEKCDPGHRYGPNKRISNVLHIVEEGKGFLEIDQKQYALEKGDAFLIPSGTEAWYEADTEQPWSYRWVGFEGISAEEIIGSAGFSTKKPVRNIQCMCAVNGFIDGMLKTHKLLYENELKRNALLLMVFSELIADNRRICLEAGRIPPVHRYSSTAYVEMAVEYITTNYDKRIKINELADYIGVNRSYLTSSFQKNMGCSPQEYLVNLRIEKAKTLLKKKDIQVSEVAAMVGYSDPFAFSKMFRKKTGRSPKEYMEEKKQLVVSKKKGDFDHLER